MYCPERIPLKSQPGDSSLSSCDDCPRETSKAESKSPLSVFRVRNYSPTNLTTSTSPSSSKGQLSSIEYDDTTSNSSTSVSSDRSHQEQYRQYIKEQAHSIRMYNYTNKSEEYAGLFDIPLLHPKVFLSFIIWFVCYMIMGFFGGALAFYHFQRVTPPPGIDVDSTEMMNTPVDEAIAFTQPLPDFGYDLIPYSCPISFNKLDMNPQTLVLTSFYVIFITSCVILCFLEALINRRRKRGNDNGIVARESRLIFQQFLHVNSLIFLARTTSVSITGFPQPNPRCLSVQYGDLESYFDAVKFVMGRGFPPRACGDLMFSGHAACILIVARILHKYRYFVHVLSSAYHRYLSNMSDGTSDRNHDLYQDSSEYRRSKRRRVREKKIIVWILGLTAWGAALTGIYYTIACRSHYTVDVVIAFYMSFFTHEFYVSRSEGRIARYGFFAQTIHWLEDRGGLKHRVQKELARHKKNHHQREGWTIDKPIIEV